MGTTLQAEKVSFAFNCGGYFSHRQIRCRESIEILATDMSTLETLMKAIEARGFFASSATPPGEGPIVFDVLCKSCVRKLYPPEVVEAALASRQVS